MPSSKKAVLLRGFATRTDLILPFRNSVTQLMIIDSVNFPTEVSTFVGAVTRSITIVTIGVVSGHPTAVH